MKKIFSGMEYIGSEGGVIPKYYGLAYRSYIKDEIICYPMPLHFIVGWLHKLYHAYVRYFKIPKCKPSAIDWMLIEQKKKHNKLLREELAKKDQAWIKMINDNFGGRIEVKESRSSD